MPADSVPEINPPALSEPVGSESPDQVRVPLASLAEDVKAGDTVQFTVAAVDPARREALLKATRDMSAAGPAARGEAPPVPGGERQNTDVLLGPMNKLKGYLMKKSQDVSRAEAP